MLHVKLIFYKAISSLTNGITEKPFAFLLGPIKKAGVMMIFCFLAEGEDERGCLVGDFFFGVTFKRAGGGHRLAFVTEAEEGFGPV